MASMSICRACKSQKLYMFLPLGSQPPANAFLRREQLNRDEPSFALDTHACLDCGLVQVPDRIPPGFFRNYVYVPSGSETMWRHFAGLAKTIHARFLSAPQALAVDIGCNDGLFLKSLKDLGSRTLGIDPATNLIKIARDKGLEIVNEYFGPQTAEAVRHKYGPARVIVTTNTFNHIDDLHAFMEGVRILLEPEGAFVVEVPHAVDYVQKKEFDTVYHEHLSTFSVKSLVDLYRFVDMEIFDIERLPIHGGSMRVFGRKKQAGQGPAPVVAEWLALEEQAGLFSADTYDAFSASVRQNKERVVQTLRQLKQQGKRIIGYGAPAKGNTLLNYYGIGSDLLDYVVDKNPLKHGLYTPGMHLPVLPAEKVLEDKPDYMFILAWNFADEIMSQQQEYHRRGGKFILPIPELQIVN